MANNGNNKKPGKPMRFNPIWLYAPVFLILATLFFVDRDITSQKELSWNEFQNIAKKQAFTDIVVNRKENTLKARVDPTKVDSVFKKGDIPSFQDRGNISDYYINTQIPSVDKFSDFYDQNQITAKVKYEDSKFSFTSILIA